VTTPEPSRATCLALDEQDPLASYRDEFAIEDDSLVYFDGNSLGRLPKATIARVDQVLREEWGNRLIRSWRESWMDLPIRVGDLIGTGLLGARPGETVLADNTTVALFKALSAALDARPDRRTVVIERDNFPTDRYIVESLARQRNLEVRWVASAGVDGVSEDALRATLDETVAVVLLSQVDYRSAAILDLPTLTRVTHEVGAVMVWDVCHSVGSIPIDLPAADVDLAVGCTYKYLNGGPGSPAFTFVNASRQGDLAQPIWGWWSRAEMFDMAQGYVAEAGIRAWLTGTPGILSMAAVETGVEMVVRAGMDRIRAKSVGLTSLAVELCNAWLGEHGVGLASPLESTRRGSHVTLTHPNAKQLSAELAERGVIPDFREPGGIRIGLAPLTTRFVDVYDGLGVLRDLLS
jgi:kynureninase